MKKQNKVIGIVGNADSIYIKRFIEYIMIPYKKEFVLFTITNKTFFDFYKENNIKVISYNTGRKDSYNKKRILKVFDCIKLIYLVNINKIDNLIIHYVSPFMLLIFMIFRFNKELVLVYWGSDVYRENSKLLSCLNKIVKKSQLVTDSEDIAKELIKIYGNEIIDKLDIIKFADSTLNVIDSLFKKREQLKEELIGNNKKYIVTIGYNAIEQQQHIKVLEQLGKLEKNEKDMLFIILPLTYPNNAEYVDVLKKKLKEIEIDSLIISEYMHEYEIARLCISTDLFIHAQTTDSMSSSMIEHIYAGSYVLNGSWLNYDYLNNNGIVCGSFNDFNELCSIVKKYPVINYDLDTVKRIIADDYGISKYQKKWFSIINKHNPN